MLDPKIGRDLRKNNKRLMIFLVSFFIFALILCYLLLKVGLSPVLAGFIIIICACVFYLLFLFICAKIDKRRAKRMQEEATKDPFIKR